MGEIADSGFLEFKQRIASAALLAIVDHWRQARRTRPMPAWSELSPSGLAPHFKRLWAYRYDRGADEFTARLAGNRAMVGFGKSFRGTPLKDIHPPHIFELAQAHMLKVVTGPMAYYCSGKLFRVGSEVVEGERIMLPLASDGHNGDGLLGATDFTPRLLAGPVELLVGQIEWFPL
jgi:hypothetical protein